MTNNNKTKMEATRQILQRYEQFILKFIKFINLYYNNHSGGHHTPLNIPNAHTNANDKGKGIPISHLKALHIKHVYSKTGIPKGITGRSTIQKDFLFQNHPT